MRLYCLKQVAIKNQPDPNSKTLKHLIRGDKVQSLGADCNGYTRVKHNHMIGYVTTKFLTPNKLPSAISIKKYTPRPLTWKISVEVSNYTDHEDHTLALVGDVEYYFSLLPKTIQKLFIQEHIRFILCDDLGETQDGKIRNGMVLCDLQYSQIIYLRVCNAKNAEGTYCFLHRTFFHECAHVLDCLISYNQGHFTYNAYTKKLMADEEISARDILGDYAFTNESEYFACAFARYMLEKNDCMRNTPEAKFQEMCPLSWGYVDQIIHYIENNKIVPALQCCQFFTRDKIKLLKQSPAYWKIASSMLKMQITGKKAYVWFPIVWNSGQISTCDMPANNHIGWNDLTHCRIALVGNVQETHQIPITAHFFSSAIQEIFEKDFLTNVFGKELISENT